MFLEHNQGAIESNLSELFDEVEARDMTVLINNSHVGYMFACKLCDMPLEACEYQINGFTFKVSVEKDGENYVVIFFQQSNREAAE